MAKIKHKNDLFMIDNKQNLSSSYLLIIILNKNDRLSILMTFYRNSIDIDYKWHNFSYSLLKIYKI